MSWLLKEAEKYNSDRDRVILENPHTVNKLDESLIHNYYPFIRSELQKTGFPYYPPESEIKIESKWNCDDLSRSLTFLMMDDFGALIFRGSITISKSAYMLEKEFFLELGEGTKPSLIFRILKDDRFMGMPPTLEIQNSKYIIKFQAGNGMGFTGWNLNSMVLEDIEAVIKDSVAMYEASIDGFSTVKDVDRFLKIAQRSFETG